MKFFEHLEGYVASQVSLVKEIFTLFKLETRLAKLNIYPLLIDLAILLALAITLWPTLALLIGYIIFALTDKILTAILGVLLLNGCFLYYLIRDIKIRLKHMSFEKTRLYLTNSQRKDSNESPEQSAVVSNCQSKQ